MYQTHSFDESKMLVAPIIALIVLNQCTLAKALDANEDEIIDLTWPVRENKTLGWPGFKTPFDLQTVVNGDPYGINAK